MADGAAKVSSGFTAQLVSEASAIASRTLPERVLERTRHAVLDWLGVTISGSRQPSTAAAISVLEAEGGDPVAQVPGSPHRMTARQAALVTGVASHSQDFDDMGMLMHPSVVVLPAAFAVAEEIDASGQDTLQAILRGYETLKLLMAAVTDDSYARGFHCTGTFGAFGAAAAVGRLLKLDPLRQQWALGIAGMQASGLRAGFGTMCKHLNAGNAAAAGVLSARLAEAGFVGPTDVIEHPQGFANAMSGTQAHFDPSRPGAFLEERLGVEGIMFKLHAACGGTHSAIDGVRAIKARRPFTVDDVEEVELVVCELLPGVCGIAEPKTAMEGMFSVRYATALALTDSDTGPDAFTDARVQDPRLTAVRELVKVTPVARLPHMSMPTEVTVRLKNGETHEACVNIFEPRPDEALSRQWADLEAKFHSLVAPILGDGRSKEIVGLVRRFESLGSLRELTSRAAFDA
ncbi:MAG TPA: MmgE/PrpD family protein [Phenylobacterium sp.]|uniref:MmgE/PrpD family protein n=1 Tax=Phenylobacterium sp. TaxID=1871053 RepID=UPI002B45CF24|nr:MmgE/PrpD family protein [Phenylobacterium sp.]HKR87440.1 MmgE/PrpD family protein [Phenylobacterium sp.]